MGFREQGQIGVAFTICLRAAAREAVRELVERWYKGWREKDRQARAAPEELPFEVVQPRLP
jgi:hypothetical protein